MRKVAIWGVGEAAKYVANELKKFPTTYTIIGFLDSYASETEIDDIKVYKPEFVFDEIEIDEVIISFTGKRGLYQVVETLLHNNINDIYLLKYIAFQEKWPLLQEKKYIEKSIRKIRFSKEKPSFLYFEMPIANHCNLNCKGCFVSCNSNDKKEEISLKEIVNDLKQMKKHFFDIPWIRFYGGEPLLFRELDQLFTIARELFPDSEIDIISNGLLIPTLSKTLLKSISDNEITVNISRYPPIERLLTRIDQTLKGNNIPYILHDKSKFIKFFTLTENEDIDKIAHNCFLSGCRHLTKGKISKCSSFITFEKLNEQFNTHYKIEKNSDWFDIYSENFDAWETVKKLNKAIPLCRYCSLKRDEYEWEKVEKAKLEDYVLLK